MLKGTGRCNKRRFSGRLCSRGREFWGHNNVDHRSVCERHIVAQKTTSDSDEMTVRHIQPVGKEIDINDLSPLN